jgi:hypothetical protein
MSASQRRKGACAEREVLKLLGDELGLMSGIWDSDNGPLSGTECAWCKAWNTARAAIRARGQA